MFDIVKAVINGEEVPLDEANLVGGRKSGKTTALFLLYILLAMVAPSDFGWVNARCRTKDADDMYKDLKNVLDAYQVEYKAREIDKELIVNGNTCRFYGVDNNRNTRGAKKAGIPHFANVKYLFIFFEERFEFTEDYVNMVKEAVRSISDDPNFHPQMIILNACNPWSRNNDYIAYCSKHQTWDISKLKTTGSQAGLYNIEIREGFVKRTLFQYTNWRVAREYLSESEIKTILDTWNIDARRAATVDYGLAGSESGAIYTHLLNNIGEAVYKDHDWIIAGGDYGWGRESTSGKTVFYFGGATLDSGIDLYGEYVQDNHTHVKDPNVVAREVVEFYQHQMQLYMEKNHKTWVPEVIVRVDNMAVGVIEILNNTARQYHFNWLKFVKCKKFPIPDRIEITLSILASQKLRINSKASKFPVKLLRNEMEFSYYEESKAGKQNRVKKDDHAINGFEYAIESVMYKFNQEIVNMKKAQKALW